MDYTDITPSNLSKNEIEKLAEKFANATGYEYPQKNIRSYLEKVGCTLVFNDDDDLEDIAGSIIIHGKNNFKIYLSRYTSPKRDIFTIAHELGHYVLHSQLGRKQLKVGRTFINELPEREANTFAAAFLMPETLFRKKHTETQGDTSFLAEFFNVSLSAVLFRCKNLNLN